MSNSQIPDEPTFPRWIKFAVGATVICFLAAGMFMLPTADLSSSYRTQTLFHAVALKSAIYSFHSEYGVLPDAPSRVKTNSLQGAMLLSALLGIEDPSGKPRNTRQIKFLSVKEGKGKRGGLIFHSAGSSPEGLNDSWGNPFHVELNVKNEEKLRFEYGGRIVELAGSLVAVYSPGKDGKPGTSDDVKTW